MNTMEDLLKYWLFFHKFEKPLKIKIKSKIKKISL